MAPVVFGLPLSEMKWSKFKSSYMWNNVYHLRRTKFIVYQCALIFLVVSESLGTAVLSDYTDQQKYLQGQDSHALEYNNDYVGVASYNIFAGIFTAFIFGSAFFFDLIWPERKESRSVRLAWKVCGVLSAIFTLASALSLTTITARHSAYVSGTPQAETDRLLAGFPKKSDPLVYHHNPRAIAAVVFVWPGWVSTVASCVILFMSIKHDEQYGPFSSHVRVQRNANNANNDVESQVSRDSLRESKEIERGHDPEVAMMNMGNDPEKMDNIPLDDI